MSSIDFVQEVGRTVGKAEGRGGGGVRGTLGGLLCNNSEGYFAIKGEGTLKAI